MRVCVWCVLSLCFYVCVAVCVCACLCVFASVYVVLCLYGYTEHRRPTEDVKIMYDIKIRSKCSWAMNKFPCPFTTCVPVYSARASVCVCIAIVHKCIVDAKIKAKCL